MSFWKRRTHTDGKPQHPLYDELLEDAKFAFDRGDTELAERLFEAPERVRKVQWRR